MIKLNGAFVDLILQNMGFGGKWRFWLKSCISTTSISVMINCTPTKPFKMERGLRQGGPLSPFLFVLVADVLNRMIGKVVDKGLIETLQVGKEKVDLLIYSSQMTSSFFAHKVR